MNEPQQRWTETIESDHSLWNIKLGEVWKYRDLVYMFVKRDFISSFKQTIPVSYTHLDVYKRQQKELPKRGVIQPTQYFLIGSILFI